MRELSERYPVWLCDIWGVVHNGVACFPRALDALARHRAAGGTVILVTNAPRPAHAIARHVAALGGGPEAYDRIVTSGDATRALLQHYARVHHIGPDRDLGIFEGLRAERTGPETGEAVLCTGLFDDTAETPEDYRSRFAALIARRLTMICANPDRLVRRGDQLIYCAGALADLYGAMGGDVAMAGKPYAPIYDLALEQARAVRQADVARAAVLAIGDGPDTDIRGAADNGFDALLIGGGILDPSHRPDELLASVSRHVPRARIVGVLDALAWVGP